VRSFINFEILPLVEFVPEPSIADEEAIDLIRQMPSDSKISSRWRESKHGGDDMIALDEGYEEDEDRRTGDPFNRCVNSTLERQGNTRSYIPVTVDAESLIHMKRSEVFVCRPSTNFKRATFYRNMLPEIAIAISQPCHRFFHLDEFEFAFLSNRACPYSKLKDIGEYGSL
jgi:intraflagellar transport protein 122